MKASVLRHLRYWVAVIFPITFGLAFVLSAGPQIQASLFSLVNSDMPSIYGSAYQESLIKFPSLLSWLKAGFEWQFLMMSLLISIVALLRSEPRRMAWRAVFASFIVLCIFDIGFGLIYGQVTARWIGENVIANLIGGILIAAVLLVILYVADFLYLHVPAGNFGRMAVAAGSSALVGLSFSCFFYYISDVFYNPLPVKFDAYFSAPVGGALAPGSDLRTSSLTGKTDVRSFSFVPEEPIKGDATWTSGEGALGVKMVDGGNGRKYKISVAFLSGCSTKEEVKKLGEITPSLVIGDSSAFEASFDSGLTNFFTIVPEEKATKIKLDVGVVSMFSLDQDSQTKRLKVTQFVGHDASLELHASNEQSFVLTAPLMNSAGQGKLSISPRVISIKIEKQTFSFAFGPPRKVSRSDKIVCSIFKDVQRQSMSESTIVSVDESTLIPGVLVKISKDDAALVDVEDMKLRVSGGNGWITLVDLQSEQLANHSAGELRMLQVRGNVTDLILDGTPATARPLDSYTAMGELRATYGSEGNLRVSGRAKSLWKDQARMNPTKWEKLDWEVKAFLLGLFSGGTAFLWRLLAQCLRGNKRFSWIRMPEVS
jgi:hypothetical protein